MRIIGVDPGLYGAVALLTDTTAGTALRIVSVPICQGPNGKGHEIMWDQLHNDISGLLFEADHAFIEQVGVRPRQSAQAGVKQGVNAGGIIGLIVAAQVPRTIVSPSVWKLQMGLVAGDKSTKAKKARSCMKATELWPAMAKEFRGEGGDGRAEAALLAQWGWNKLHGLK